jgi:hypothetical protein
MTDHEDPDDGIYEATRQEFYPNDPPQALARKNDRGMYVVQELIHHGNYRSLRRVEVYELNEVTVDAILQSSAYCYGSFAGPQENPLYTAPRNAHLKHLVSDLKRGRVNRSIGWSTFRVLKPEEDA